MHKLGAINKVRHMLRGEDVGSVKFCDKGWGGSNNRENLMTYFIDLFLPVIITSLI